MLILSNQSLITNGDIVRLALDAPRWGGQLGYVYTTYPDYDQSGEIGVQIILKDGEDTGGWSREEQKKWVEHVRCSGFDYQFTNVIKLDRDYAAGVFNQVFGK